MVRRWTTFGPPPEPRGGERQDLRGETPHSEGGVRTLGTAADLLDGALVFRLSDALVSRPLMPRNPILNCLWLLLPIAVVSHRTYRG